MVLKGFFQKIIFKNYKNGYSVFTIRNGDVYTTCAGIIPDLAYYTPLVLDGEFGKEDRHPETFVLHKDIALSKDHNQSIGFISNGLNTKLKYEEAEQILNCLPEGLFQTVDSAKKAEEFVNYFPDDIVKKYKKYLYDIYNKTLVITKSKDLFQEIISVGGTYSDVSKLVESYGNVEALNKLKENPYYIGLYLNWAFKIPDSLAQKYDFHPWCEERARGVLYYSMRKITGNGNTYATAAMLRKQIRSCVFNSVLGDIPEEYVLSFVATSKKFHIKYINNEVRIYEKSIFEAEQKLLSNVDRLCNGVTALPYDEVLAKRVQKQSGMELSDDQKHTFHSLKTSGIKIITGGPGCGKTTTINLLIRYCELCYPDKSICLCAPTGCAAQKMAEKSDKIARTIHFLLGMRPFSGQMDIAYNSLNRLHYGIYIVDECSMVDLNLMSLLLDAIPNGSLILLVGDADQLPSVGPGNVLNDFIQSGMFETYRLNTIFRQKDASGNIIANAKKINQGFSDLGQGDDFQIFYNDSEENVLNDCLDYLKKDKKKYQVLCPMKKHLLGTFNLNHILQKINRGENTPFKVYGDTFFYEGDKVIAVINNRDKGYFNGEPGIIDTIDEDGMLIRFTNGDETYVKNSHLDEIIPAHAMTVHKSQGNEYEEVVLVLSKNSKQMITRKIMYTAVTRAKNVVTIFAQKGCVDDIKPDIVRKTGLTEELIAMY